LNTDLNQNSKILGKSLRILNLGKFPKRMGFFQTKFLVKKEFFGTYG